MSKPTSATSESLCHRQGYPAGCCSNLHCSGYQAYFGENFELSEESEYCTILRTNSLRKFVFFL